MSCVSHPSTHMQYYKYRELLVIPVGGLNFILEHTRVVPTIVNLHYTFCRRAFFDFLLVCHLLTHFHIHMAYECWQSIEDRLHSIINWQDQLDLFQSIINCCFLPSRHFNFVTRVLFSLHRASFNFVPSLQVAH